MLCVLCVFSLLRATYLGCVFCVLCFMCCVLYDICKSYVLRDMYVFYVVGACVCV